MDWKLAMVGLLVGALVGATGMGGGWRCSPASPRPPQPPSS
jgi:uncharacterized membrane protein YfcA